MNRDDAIRTANDILQKLADSRLRPLDARLYSQHSRLRHGQPGLSSWQPAQAMARLDDAGQLLHAGLLLRSAAANGWRDCVRRAGEILEWLSHPAMQLANLPTQLLSAAAYGLAGYPARADALLRIPAEAKESSILRAYLRGDYPGALEAIRNFWEQQMSLTASSNGDGNAIELAPWAASETIRALGVLCAGLRWQNEGRVAAAVEKLDALATLLTIDSDPYSWLLARLTTECARETITHAWGAALSPLTESMTATGREAFDRYARLCYSLRRAVAWPSQEDGIQRLVAPGSFALCTPTGSGKTSVAEVAILQAILNATGTVVGPVCLYLVPSRALAAEVEGKLHRVLRHLTGGRIVVTGLYGGTDWGPTDAWLTADDPTVLICTYEKGEALIRFLGPLFLGRLSLVVFDEAHMVQFDQNLSSLRDAENRSLRLESLAMRIRQLMGATTCRMIALSAVAAGLEDSLHRWVGGDPNGQPVLTGYRSTRQLIGRLECDTSGKFSMRYDLLDGRSLTFSGDSDASPYVPYPIPSCPPGPTSWIGIEKSLRPALLWAALHFAARDDRGTHHAVLISVPQRIAGFASDFLQLLERTWIAQPIPVVLRAPRTEQERATWEQTIAVCDDYFGPRSYEARLLRFGIVTHHSSMPKLLTRLLIDVVQAGIANVVLATSTLSEGVNIPVETILVPSLLRGASPMPAAEFRNLAGRAGRPGIATEGRTLVLLRPSADSAFQRYRTLVQTLLSTARPEQPRSPIAAAINDIWQQWRLSTGLADETTFLQWLETVPLSSETAQTFGSLDALDGVLLSGYVEHEEIRALADWEASLQELWRGTFNAHTAAERDRQAFLTRGKAIPSLYPERPIRRQLYRSGLPPSTAIETLALLPEIRQTLVAGSPYASWTTELRIAYIGDVIAVMNRIRRFRCDEEESVWREQLRWWLQAPPVPSPRENEVAQWHKNVSQWFTYRFCWGLGSVIGVSVDALHGGELLATSLDEWEQTGLPWIVFWMKELLAWGTLDPAAAFLLGRGLAKTRPEAMAAAIAYYDSPFAAAMADPLDPRAIRAWAESTIAAVPQSPDSIGPRRVAAVVIDQSIATIRRLAVLPTKESDGIAWLDPAGFDLARTSNMPWEWNNIDIERTDFYLLPIEQAVIVTTYL